MKVVIDLTRRPYEAPRTEAIFIESQGILCASEILGNSIEQVTIEEFDFP